MTETRIRWSDAPETVEVIGWVGTMASHVFTIWPPEEDGENGGEYLLTGRLPDHHGTRFYGTRDELKAEAERWLERFVSSLGAVFPDEAYEFPGDDEWLEVTWAAGRRVRFAHPDAGYPGEAEEAMKALTPGEVYTIAWADIGQSRTDLNLARDRKSVGRFNSVFFEPADDEAASTAGEDR